MGKYCEIYLNTKKQNILFTYDFEKDGEYILIFHTLLSFTKNMISDCSSLKSLDLSNINTYNIKDMSYMFSECYSLTSFDLSNFNNIIV